jgi:hypothetical protein
MKYLLIIIALLVAVAAALMFVPVKDGKTLLSPGQVQEMLKSAGAPVPEVMQEADNAEVLPTMFRWRDSKGNWQYGDRPPPGVEAEPVEEKKVQSLKDYRLEADQQ